MTEFFSYLLKCGICLSMFFSFYWLFLKNETYFTINRFYLMFSIFLSVSLPLIHLTSPFFRKTTPLTSEIVMTSEGISNGHSLWLPLLSGIYLTGVVVFLCRFTIRLISLIILIRKYGTSSNNGIKLVFIDGNFSPFSFFNSIFLGQDILKDKDIERIIAHEHIHIKQYHSLDLMILEVMSIFQWFNPFVWPYKKSLKETHEYLADQGVIAQGFSPAKYQMLIFEYHVGVKLIEFANNFDRSQIKRRITMMTKVKSKKWSKSKVLLVIPVFLFLLIAFADSKPVDLSKTVINDDSSGVTQKAISDDTVQSQEKEKEKQQKTEMEKNLTEKEKKMIEKLKMEYEKTDDPEVKKKIKEKVNAILAGKAQGNSAADELSDKEKKLKTMLEKTDDPNERDKIKLELKKIQTLKEELKVKEIKAKEVKEKELKAKEEAKEKEKKK